MSVMSFVTALKVDAAWGPSLAAVCDGCDASVLRKALKSPKRHMAIDRWRRHISQSFGIKLRKSFCPTMPLRGLSNCRVSQSATVQGPFRRRE